MWKQKQREREDRERGPPPPHLLQAICLPVFFVILALAPELLFSPSSCISWPFFAPLLGRGLATRPGSHRGPRLLSQLGFSSH